MPFQSEKQRKYLWANEPAIAKRWEKYPKGYNTGGVSHLFRSKYDAGDFVKKKIKKYTEEGIKEDIGKWLKDKGVDLTVEEWRSKSLKEKLKLWAWKFQPFYPGELEKGKDYNSGGYVRPEEDGVLGLADGGQLVKPGPGRPGYNGDYDMDWGSEAETQDTSSEDHGAGDPDQFNMTPPAQNFPDWESGSPENTWATMSDEMAEKSKAETERVLGDHGDPMGSPEEQAKYARYVKHTIENQPLNKTEDLTFKEHWDNAPGILKYSLVLRGLYAAGKNLAEWARSKGWNWNSTTGKVTDNDGNEVSESDMQGATASQAPYMVGGTTPVNSTATQWYSTLGSSPSNPGAFDLTAQYAKAKTAVSQRLGNSTSVGQLAVNQSPFYNWLKDNSLNKGIL